MLYYIIPRRGNNISRHGPVTGITHRLAYGVFFAGILMSGWTSTATVAAEGPRVVASIKPIHSIIAGIMRGVGTPALLLKGGASPHAYALRPSDARLLRRAELVFWVGPGLESFLERPLKTIARDAAVVSLISDPRIRALPVRRGGIWRQAHTPSDGHGHDRGPRHRGGTAHDTYGNRSARIVEIDPHIWLDPRNAVSIARIAAKRLRRLDPGNARIYDANLLEFADRLGKLEHEIRTTLAPVREVPYLVFHDAFQYFERRFGMNTIGSITLSPERRPGAKRLIEIRTRINSAGLKCVFVEPQFRAALAKTIVRGTSARMAMLDPMGTLIAPGPDTLATTLRAMARSIRDCLS